jgi:integrase
MFINDTVIQILKNKNYKESSIKNVDYAVKRLFKMIYGEKTPYNSLRLSKYPDTFISAIQSLPTNQQKQNIYIINLIYTNLPDKFKNPTTTEKYKSFLDEKNEEYQNLTTMQEPTQKQTERYVTDEEITQVYDYFKSVQEAEKQKGINTYETDIKYLIISLYKFVPPLRPQVYLNTVFEDKEDDYPDSNVYDVDSKTLLVKQGKTLKKGKVIVIPIPDNVNTLIRYIKNKYNTDYLIGQLTDGNQQMDHTNFSKIFTRMFETVLKKPISPNNIRNSYISNLIDTVGLTNTSQRQKIAKILGNSVSTQNNIYSKYSKLIHGNN